MARPRMHDLDELLDVAERLMAADGASGLTLRGLAAAAGVSNGSIYHAFSSKDELLARVWLRTAERFLRMQTEQVDAALADAAASPVEAVVRAASAPVEFAGRYPVAARLFFTQRLDRLSTPELPEAVAAGVASVRTRFTAVLIRLSDAMWQRHDAAAVEAIAACVVDVPSGLMRRRLAAANRLDDLTGPRIATAARAVLSLGPPAPGGSHPAQDPPTDSSTSENTENIA